MSAKKICRWKGGRWGWRGWLGWGSGMRPKKAYMSETTEPNLKNEYVLESA